MPAFLVKECSRVAGRRGTVARLRRAGVRRFCVGACASARTQLAALGTAVYHLKGASKNSVVTSGAIDSQGFVTVVLVLLLLGRCPLNMLIDGECDPNLALSTWSMPAEWLPDKFHCLNLHICKCLRVWMENWTENLDHIRCAL